MSNFQTTIIVSTPNIWEELVESRGKEIIGENFKPADPDYLEISDSEKNSIGIDLVKNLLSFASKKPFGSGGKLIVIKEAEKLTVQAQNSLLKILEEPPESTAILLLMQNINSTIDTVISRCKIIYNKEKIETLESEFNFTNLNIVEKFKFIEDLSKIPSQTTRMNEIKKFLLAYKNSIESDILSQENNNKLKQINEVFMKIKANCNVKLTLEALVVN